MIKNQQWNDKECPTNIPMIRGKAARRRRHEVADTLANAAVAIVKALSPSTPAPRSPTPTSTVAASKTDGMSPGKKVQLRSQYLKQLKAIQTLRDEQVLSPDEFKVEKDIILNSLHELK